MFHDRLQRPRQGRVLPVIIGSYDPEEDAIYIAYAQWERGSTTAS